MTGIPGHITALRIKDGGPDGYDSIELVVDIPIPRLTAYYPEKPHYHGELSEWEKERMAEYEKEMEKYRKAERIYKCKFDNTFSLCLEEITIYPSRDLKWGE